MAASTSDVGLPVGDGLGQEEFDEDGEDEEGELQNFLGDVDGETFERAELDIWCCTADF